MDDTPGHVGSIPSDAKTGQKLYGAALDKFALRRTITIYCSTWAVARISKLVFGLKEDTAVRRYLILLVIFKYTTVRWLPYLWLSGGPKPVQIASWDTICVDLRYLWLESQSIWLLEFLHWILFSFSEAWRTLVSFVLTGLTLFVAFAVIFALTPARRRDIAIASYHGLNTWLLAHREMCIEWVDSQVRSRVLRAQDQARMDLLYSLDNVPVPHKRLRPGRYIRLLRLHRKLPFQSVRGTLEHVPLDAAPPFVAISYTWGYRDPPYYVILDEVKYRVTGNAHRALCSLSSMWRSRLLWIDSICIDQTNLKERGKQVQLMRDIYKRAKQTVVCLGAARDAHLAIQLLSELSIATQLHSIHQVLESYKEEASSPRFLALNKLVRNPWFDRVWIVQEVAMSSNIQVYYGNQSLGWETLLSLLLPDLGGAVFSPAQLCQSIFPHQRTGDNRVGRDPMEPHHIFLLSRQQQLMKQGKKASLFHLLYMTLSFEATEKKDQIFALQGISEEGFAHGEPDYSEAMSSRNVFVKTARDILCSELDHRLSLLSVAGTGFGRATTDLPSWVPEWGGGAPTTSSFTNPGCPREVSSYDYQAHGKTSPDISFSVNPDILILGGVYADTIAVIGQASPIQHDNMSVTDPSTHTEYLNRRTQWTKEAWHLAQLHALPEDPTGQPLLEAFWRTCMGDRLIGPSGVVRPAPAVCHSYFSAALKMRSNLTHWVKSNQAEPGSFEHYYHTGALDRAFRSEEEAVECNRLAQEFEGPMGIHVARRKFCVTEGGYIGVVPPESQVGDYVCIFYGAQTPFVLRLFDDDETGNGQMEDIHKLLGECYFHGMMDGEMVNGDVEGQYFAIR